jgi:hypothetical protein
MAEAYAVLTFIERQRNAQGQTLNAEYPVTVQPPSAAGTPDGEVAWSDLPGGAMVADQERQELERAVAQPEAQQPAVSPERQALEQELRAKRRRLYALEVQYRYFGPKTPPQILSELEELRGMVKELEGRLKG